MLKSEELNYVLISRESQSGVNMHLYNNNNKKCCNTIQTIMIEVAAEVKY